MSIGVTGMADKAVSMAMAAPGFTVLVAAFLVISMLESWRPFFARRAEPDGRLLVNFGLGIINAVIQFAVPVSVLLVAAWAQNEGIGLLNYTDWPVALDAVITILAVSLTSYWAHRVSHGIHPLWRLHHVHHSDTHVDLSTGFRNHPAELVYVVALMSAAALAVGFLPAALLGYQIATAAFSLWSHSDFELPPRVDRLLRAVFVTPGMHHVHHSALKAQTDSNYGEVFSFWDRLFGTYCYMSPEQLRAMRIGLGDEYDTGAASLTKQLAAPARI